MKVLNMNNITCCNIQLIKEILLLYIYIFIKEEHSIEGDHERKKKERAYLGVC